jgi:hypothetical protein
MEPPVSVFERFLTNVRVSLFLSPLPRRLLGGWQGALSLLPTSYVLVSLYLLHHRSMWGGPRRVWLVLKVSNLVRPGMGRPGCVHVHASVIVRMRACLRLCVRTARWLVPC